MKVKFIASVMCGDPSYYNALNLVHSEPSLVCRTASPTGENSSLKSVLSFNSIKQENEKGSLSNVYCEDSV